MLQRLGLPGAWFGAAIWALHPVQVESVAWISELKNALMCFFFLLSLQMWTRFLEKKLERKAYNNLGNALFQKGRMAEAVVQYHEALKLAQAAGRQDVVNWLTAKLRELQAVKPMP